MERCPKCDMDIEPDCIRVFNFDYDTDNVSVTVQYKCPECGGFYRKKEFFKYESSDVID